MARINSNISSLTAQFNLQRNNDDLELRLQRLATGIRINRGADDPAGLIVSERLRSELEGIKQGVKNSERASNVIATTEGGLSEVSALLNTIKALVVEAANTGAFSTEEIQANQLQIDSAIESITRIANTASFAGLKLLNGELSYSLSSVDSADIAIAQVNGALFGDRDVIDVDVDVIGSAQTANLYFNTDYANFPTLSGGAGGVSDSLPREMVVEIAGPDGVIELTLASGSTNQDIINAINSRTSITGITAAAVSAADLTSGLVFSSVEYGTDAFVSVKVLSGGHTDYTFAKIADDGPGPIDWAGGAGTQWSETDSDRGKDVVVLLNGAVATGRGLEVNVRGPELDVSLLLTSQFATDTNNNSTTFHITGGGATFQLGPQVNANQQVNIGIGSIASTRLGASYLTNEAGDLEVQFLSSLKSGGDNALRGNLQNASKILESAIDDVATLRGRLGAFERNVLDANIRSLQSGIENITASESVIRDADFAAETSNLTRAQVLGQSSTSVLALANQQAQNVLALLG
jgi:flagellin